MEKSWDEEIMEEIKKILILVEKQQEYDHFGNNFVVYKKGKKNEKIQKWLKNENVLKMLDLKTENQKNKENDVFKEILNFDEKYQRVLENHLRKIEEMKENLNNFTQEKENLEELMEKSELKNENYGDVALKIEKNDENKQNFDFLFKKNEEKNKPKIEKSPILEERVVLRSK